MGSEIVLEQFEDELLRLARECGENLLTWDEWRERRDELIKRSGDEKRRIALNLPADRPPRSEPTMLSIARHHGVDGQPAFCWKCGAVPGSGDWRRGHNLIRAHVIDRVSHGLDHQGNRRPLCDGCHRAQPIFEAGDEEAALAWFDESW